jgi:hypothetical protein
VPEKGAGIVEEPPGVGVIGVVVPVLIGMAPPSLGAVPSLSES